MRMGMPKYLIIAFGSSVFPFSFNDLGKWNGDDRPRRRFI
ncbi:hypothetical protein SLEP1_g54556 [Rubroshorea leprosula]|uniref:Uncharacterized protein n=1 Tax=Rubroshorea leprosula TaxID=152421 RepID=A0AAV5MFA9_9ROSI|nr:hypothetical protein SLEP1_g54556 [Rubroshorea leprosula]